MTREQIFKKLDEMCIRDRLQGICGEISKGEGCMAAAAAADGAS